MIFISTTKEMITTIKKIPLPIGFVPTMGNLHAGHLSLIQRSLEENPSTIITIFINPKQFSPSEDFKSYPKTIEQDQQQIRHLGQRYANKNLILFCPKDSLEIFPSGFQTSISIEPISNALCGLFRSGHFNGVATVIYQLFSICKPQVSYFGQKDYQQYKIIERLVSDLRFDIKLISLPTIYDSNGLALSSRNQYLTKEERIKALALPKIIKKTDRLIRNGDFPRAIEISRQTMQENNNFQYLKILDADNLMPVSTSTQKILIAGAILFNKTRLIDNSLINQASNKLN